MIEAELVGDPWFADLSDIGGVPNGRACHIVTGLSMFHRV